jgi:hypothetical protein
MTLEPEQNTESSEDEETSPSLPLPPDWLLAIFVSMANDVEMELSICLHVSGQLVSGTLISGRRYFREFADQWEESFRQLGTAEDARMIAEPFAELAKIYDRPPKEDATRRPPPAFIHLRDARVFAPGSAPIPGNRGVLWRGRLESISGFFLGKLDVNT